MNHSPTLDTAHIYYSASSDFELLITKFRLKLKDHGKSKRVPEKHLFLLYWLCQSLWCVDHNTLWKILQDMGIPGGSTVKRLAYNAGDLGSIPGLGRSSGEGNGNPLQYSYLENPMDRGAWWATVHWIAKSQTRLSDFTFFTCLLWNLYAGQEAAVKTEHGTIDWL